MQVTFWFHSFLIYGIASHSTAVHRGDMGQSREALEHRAFYKYAYTYT